MATAMRSVTGITSAHHDRQLAAVDLNTAQKSSSHLVTCNYQVTQEYSDKALINV